MICSEFRLIENELHCKGLCYIVTQSISSLDATEILDDMISYCVQNGAAEIRFSFGDRPVEPELEKDILARYGFHYATEIYLCVKRLNRTDALSEDRADPGLKTKKLTKTTIQMYTDYYNAMFIDVPNARTRSVSDIDNDQNDPRKELGFFLLNGLPIGVYQIDYSEIPEISAIALLEEYRHRRLGERCLESLEGKILETGHSQCQLTVASSNTYAMRLYERMGYKKERMLSVWYAMQPRKGNDRRLPEQDN